MKLAPREVEKLALHGAGFLAQKRLARGLQLNYTEAIALIATQVLSEFLVTCTVFTTINFLGRICWTCLSCVCIEFCLGINLLLE